MVRRIATIALLALGMSAADAQSQAPAPTLQQLFDQASRASGAGDCATALPIFERLASDPRVRPGSLPAASIAVRRGVCLATVGRYDESREQILAGLPVLRGAGADLTDDVATGEETLGSIALREWDHDSAIAHFQTAAALRPEQSRIYDLSRIAMAAAFDHDGTATTAITEALRIAAGTANTDKRTLANLHTIQGRILMNEGHAREALVALKQALALAGGLSMRVDLTQVSMRGDLAEAALLNGQKEDARLYLAYTGAGRIAQSPFTSAASMSPPPCGPETGLDPDDVAIVEFGIGDDGDVTNTQTVYSRDGYAKASAFARAVSTWYWRPADLAKIPAFYRLLTRVEVRCSTSGGSLPGVVSPLEARLAAWMAPVLGESDVNGEKVGADLERLAALAAQRERAGDKPGLVAALVLRSERDPTPDQATVDDLERARTIAGSAGLPREVINAIDVSRLATISQARYRIGTRRIAAPPSVTADMESLAASPAIAGDALAQDTLLLLLVPREPAQADALLSRVADDARLPDRHPLRQVALLRLANIAAAAGSTDKAQTYFQRTGLNEEQCSLIGATPALRRTGASSADFPMAAIHYGFEGWVRLEFDINADGTAARARPVVAYPPFVFVDAATGMARDFRYEASYRPSGGAACTARQETVLFQMR